MRPTGMRAGSAAASRRAATGRTREARTAGAAPATSATSVPTATPMMTVLDLNTRPPAGRENPKASNMPFSRPATPTPPSRPATEATTPTAADSSRTDPRTWARVAPTARSSADSRLRWAAMIEKVL